MAAAGGGLQQQLDFTNPKIVQEELGKFNTSVVREFLRKYGDSTEISICCCVFFQKSKPKNWSGYISTYLDNVDTCFINMSRQSISSSSDRAFCNDRGRVGMAPEKQISGAVATINLLFTHLRGNLTSDELKKFVGLVDDEKKNGNAEILTLAGVKYLEYIKKPLDTASTHLLA